MLMIASDGAGRNGIENYPCSYGVVASDGYNIQGWSFEGTSQRGEVLGAKAALEYAVKKFNGEPIALIFDSAYVANALKQRWFEKWKRNGWITSTGDKVKNLDLWKQIADLALRFDEDELCIFQIKGHTTLKGPKSVAKCKESFIKNNGGLPPDEVLTEMIVLNNLADMNATEALNEAKELAGVK